MRCLVTTGAMLCLASCQWLVPYSSAPDTARDAPASDAPIGGEGPRRDGPRDSVNTEAARTDLIPDGPKVDGKKGDGPRTDGKGDGPRADAKKGDGPEGDAKKGDAKKNDGPKADAKKGDGPKADAKKGDGPKGDGPKVDAKKGDGPKLDGKKEGAVAKLDGKKEGAVAKLDGKKDGGGWPCDITEGQPTLALSTYATCGTLPSGSNSVYYQPSASYVKVGAVSAQLTCNSCPSQQGMRFTRSSSWDLSSYPTVQLWFYTQNISWNAGMCGLTPAIVLTDTSSNKRWITRSSCNGTPCPNLSTNSWLQIEAPTSGYSGDWGANGTVNLGAIKSIDIIFSNPSNSSYVVRVDGLTFIGGPVPFNQCSP